MLRRTKRAAPRRSGRRQGLAPHSQCRPDYDIVDRFIDWYQGTRWYFYRWAAGSPYRNHEISTQSANVHIVPASVNLRRALFALEPNQRIELAGDLVRVEDARGHRWQSSLSRTDSGGGSCELMYVQALIHDGRKFE